MAKQKIYAVFSADGECGHFVAAFSTPEARDVFMRPYETVVEKYGADCISLFSLSRYDIEVDSRSKLPYTFYRKILQYKDEDGETKYFISIAALADDEKKYYLKRGKFKNSDRRFRTFTLDEDLALKEAKKYFQKIENKKSQDDLEEILELDELEDLDLD